MLWTQSKTKVFLGQANTIIYRGIVRQAQTNICSSICILSAKKDTFIVAIGIEELFWLHCKHAQMLSASDQYWSSSVKLRWSYFHSIYWLCIHFMWCGIEGLLSMVLKDSDCPDSKVHGANMGLIWGQQDPGGPHVGPMNFVIWVHKQCCHQNSSKCMTFVVSILTWYWCLQKEVPHTNYAHISIFHTLLCFSNSWFYPYSSHLAILTNSCELIKSLQRKII